MGSIVLLIALLAVVLVAGGLGIAALVPVLAWLSSAKRRIAGPRDGGMAIGEARHDALLIVQPDAERQVRTFLSAHPGRKIEAIKLTRELTGLGLGDAKSLVDRWSHDPAGYVAATRERDTVRYGYGAVAQIDEHAMEAAEQAVRSMRDARVNKIAAIKRVREQTGLGLKQAKEFVDARWR